jgi:hypothetical protein
MVAQIDSSSEDARGTAGNPCVPVRPAGTIEGDLLVCVHACDLNGSLAGLTAPSGWTQIGSGSRTDAGFMKVWRLIAGPSEPASYSFASPVGSDTSAVILDLYGQDPNAPIAVSPTFASGAAATAHPAPSVAGVADGLLVTAHLAGTSGSSRSYTPPSGMTEQRESKLSTSPNIVLEVNTQGLTASGQTGSKSATCSASTPYVTMSLVVSPVIAVVTVSPDTPDATGKANDATIRASSRATPGTASTTGAAPRPPALRAIRRRLLGRRPPVRRTTPRSRPAPSGRPG